MNGQLTNHDQSGDCCAFCSLSKQIDLMLGAGFDVFVRWFAEEFGETPHVDETDDYFRVSACGPSVGIGMDGYSSPVSGAIKIVVMRALVGDVMAQREGLDAVA